MGKLRAGQSFYIAVLVMSVAVSGWGQSAPADANADIVKMIQAGLPESTIVNKIHEGAGRWNTSVDGLILLKQAGATEGELLALTSTPESKPTAELLPKTVDEGQQVLGGVLKNHQGSVTLAVAGDPNGYASLFFRVVLFDGEPSLVTQIMSAKETPFKKGPCIQGDLLITKDRTTFFPYAVEACVGSQKWSLASNLTPISNPIKDVHYPKMGKNGTNFELGYQFGHKDNPTPTRAFLDLLFSDFSGTVATILHAAGISDPAGQLDPASHYVPPSKDEAVAIVEQHNQAINSAQKYAGINAAQRVLREQEEAKLHPQPTSDSGNGLLSALNVVQGVTNMHQAFQNAKVADASHDVAGQMRAARDATTAEMQTLGAASGNSTAIQPLAATQPAPSPVSSQPAAVAPKATGFTYNISHGQAPSVSTTAKTVPPAKTVAYAKQPKATTNPRGITNGVGTGTAPPPNCVYLSDAQPCVPLDQYQQMQKQQQASGQGICPPSGFVPGVMLRVESDVAEPVPCKPGTPYGPLIATTASGGFTGVTPPDASSAGGGSTGSTGASGSSALGVRDPDLRSCITPSYKGDPITGSHLILQNTCSVSVQVFFYADSQDSGGVTLSPGGTDNTYVAENAVKAAGGVSIYACPDGDFPRKPDGTLAYTGVNNQYGCFRK
jgi:hypothetical protein